MAQLSKKLFTPQIEARLDDGSKVTPESKEEEDYLLSIGLNNEYDNTQKERLAKFGTMFEPVSFNVDFLQQKRENHPKELDDHIRKLVREV